MSFPPVKSEPLAFGATSHSSTGLMTVGTSEHVKLIEFRLPSLKASPSISCQIMGGEKKSIPLSIHSLKINENVGGKTQIAIQAQTLDGEEAKGEHYCNIVVIEPKPFAPPEVTIPKGTILPWYSKDKKPPRGWQLCDGIDGRPNFNGIWMVGTDDPETVGQVMNLNSIEIGLSGTATSTGTANKYPVSGHAGDPPHAPGMDHTHPVNVSGTFDRNRFAPPSMRVRYIIRID